MLAVARRGVEVLQRRAPLPPRQEAPERVPDGVRFHVVRPRHITERFQVHAEEVRRGPTEVGPPPANVVGLAE